MESTLQEQILAYQAIAQQAKSAGRKLVQRLESLGWTMLECVFDYDSPVMISPELINHQDWERAEYNEDDRWWEIEAITRQSLFAGENDWSDHIVEISVID
jgi:hypothetical protein